jgi:hypothetical protein
MGQRFQAYLRINNPLKNKDVVEDLKTKDGKQLKHARAIFGKGKTSVIAFHHQWLYGMTAPAICLNILRQVDKSASPEHVFNKEFGTFPYPKDYRGDTDKVDGYFELIETLLFNQFDTDFAAYGARYGVERVVNLVEELYDRKTGKMDLSYDYRKDFTLGDNNDGIMIIDVISKKYCFMNIYKQDKDPDCSSVASLPTLKPVSAEKYANAYYATKRKKLSSYYVEDRCKNDEKKIQELLIENQKKMVFVSLSFDAYPVLTLDEVKEMFPKVYEPKKEAIK